MKQKFALFVLLLALWTVNVEAKRITVSQAQKQACIFWNKQMPTRSKVKFRKANVECLQDANGMVGSTDAYYVFNNDDGGFVIIAGDDAVAPVLGYANHGYFNADSIPDGLKDLLASYGRQIALLDDNAQSLTDSYVSSISAYSGEKLLNTAKWNQDKPFNKYVPNQCPVGCVATAGAIVMKHHGYPRKGTGSNSYIWNGRILSANFEHEYDWDSMPGSYTYNVPSSQYNGVAMLMFDLGVAVNMDYTKDGSGASMLSLVDALQTYFGYSKYSKILPIDYYSYDGWVEKLRGEIDANRPVIYSATDASAGGHAFVLDGYRGNSFSVNWGWGGYCDGFYVIGALNPGIFSSYKFNLNQSAVFDLQPSDGKEIIPELVVYYSPQCINGANMSTTDVRADQPFMFTVGPLLSQAESGSFTGEVAVVLKDSKGNVKDMLASDNIQDLKKGYYYYSYSFVCEPSVDAVEGDYLALVCTDGRLEVKNLDDSDFHVPATGYTPKTTEIIANLGEGLRIDDSMTDRLAFYDGKPLLGCDYCFNVLHDESIKKCFVEVDGKEPDIRIDSDGSFVGYLIHNVYKPSYQLEVVTYRNYQEKSCEVNVEEPGQLLDEILREGYDDYQYTAIKVKGTMDQRDFETLNNECHFQTIDLGECRIVAYGDSRANAIPESAFASNTRLLHFVMPNGVTILGDYAFMESGLVDIKLPETITSFGCYTFFQCYQLADVYMYHKEAPYSIGENVFADGDVPRTLHLHKGCKEKYLDDLSTQNWIGCFDEIVEDLDEMEADMSPVAVDGKQAVLYDLNGCQMPVQEPSFKGLYIVNGKKIIRK